MNEEQQNTSAEGVNTNEAAPQQQSQLATVLIGILVIIAGFLTYNFLQTRETGELNIKQNNQVPASEASPTASSQEAASTYVVQPGDTLSSIAETVYGNAQNWREIAKANDISLERPVVRAGDELKLPAIGGPKEITPSASPTETKKPEELAQNSETATSVTPTSAETAKGAITPTPENETITETPVTAVQTYVVQRGDTLWAIAKQFYGDGTQWHKIFTSNHLSMYQSGTSEFPLIHAGNILAIPD